MTNTALLPLVKRPPSTCAIVVVVVEGPPAYIQIDLFTPGENHILARYTTPIGNSHEATLAFETMLSGTMMGLENNNLTTMQVGHA